MSQENVDTVKGGYDDFNSGNIEGLLGRLADDIAWTEPGGGNSPSGTFTGHDSVRDEVFGTVPQNFDEFTCTAVEADDQGDTVVIKARFAGKNKSGATLNAMAEHIWNMRDGKVARFEHKPDDPDAWAQGWS